MYGQDRMDGPDGMIEQTTINSTERIELHRISELDRMDLYDRTARISDIE